MSNINADDLRELKKLLDEGVISQEEFDKKKAEFLDEDFQDKDSLAKEKSANFTKQSTSENEVNSKDEKYPQSKKMIQMKIQMMMKIKIITLVKKKILNLLAQNQLQS